MNLVEIGAIKYGKFTLSSGQESNVYIDIKHALLHPKANSAIVDKCFDLLPKNIDTIAGYGLGGTLLVSSLMNKISRENLPINGVIIREKPKEYGTKLQIEGIKGNNIVLLEDVITTGKSCLKALEVIECKYILSVVNRNDIKFIAGIPVLSVLWSKDVYSP